MLGPAGKTIVCAGDATAFTCMAVGYNAELIAEGVVARVNVVLARGETAATIEITDAVGVSAGGYPIPIAATGGTITAGTGDKLPAPLRQRTGGK